MTIDTNQHFPLDHLLQCGLCGAPMHLEERPDLAYACAGRAAQPAPCGAPYLRAAEANRHLLRQVMSVIITDSTFGTFREQVGGALAEAGQAPPEEDELRRTRRRPRLAARARAGGGGRDHPWEIHRPHLGPPGHRRSRVQAAAAPGNPDGGGGAPGHQPAGKTIGLSQGRPRTATHRG